MNNLNREMQRTAKNVSTPACNPASTTIMLSAATSLSPLTISVVMPVRNEENSIEATVLQTLGLLEEHDELIVVDGESTDQSLSILKALSAKYARLQVLSSRSGRAVQMNTGARKAKGEVLLFLHADTVLSPQSWLELKNTLQTAGEAARFWGRFDVRISGKSYWLPVVSRMMNWRSRFSRICTGDQAIYISTSLFNRIGQFPDQPLMEDVEICKTLKTQSDALFLPLNGPVHTSGRRWDEAGAWPTILLMWRFRFLYWRGTNAYDLAMQYREIRSRPPASFPMEQIAREQDLS